MYRGKFPPLRRAPSCARCSTGSPGAPPGSRWSQVRFPTGFKWSKMGLAMGKWWLHWKTIGKTIGKPLENGGFMGIEWNLPSGKRLHGYMENHLVSWENLTCSMAMFIRKLLNYQRIQRVRQKNKWRGCSDWKTAFHEWNMSSSY